MVPPNIGGEALPDRRYVVANRNRRHHDYAAPRCDEDQTWIATVPFPGIDADLLDSRRQPVKVGGGFLVLKTPWPGMLRTIYGDDARYKEHVLEQVPRDVLHRRRGQT